MTASQAADSPQIIPVLGTIRVPGPVGRPRTRPDAVAGDKAYSSRGNRVHLRKRGIKAVIPEKKDQAANRRRRAAAAAGLSGATPTCTRRGTPSSARSTRSRPGEASPPNTTRTRTATSRASTCATR
ncbi:transposase [Streptomyces sp. NPDC093676]|uniref:transposase n=1 Tax=Streptomyces sp. NPDC093676 TaxID=3366050 RepID=UPI00382D0197